MDDNERSKITKAVVLNCLMYFDQLKFHVGEDLYTTVTESINANPEAWKKMMSDSPGVMTGNKAQAIIDEILNNSDYSNLVIKAYTLGESLEEFKDIEQNGNMSIKTGGPVAICLENPTTKEVDFVYRGTNVLEWLDNAEGFVQESSRLQKEALSFLEKNIEKYGYDRDDYLINVSGHSKGGNKAQYVTITSKYDIDSCINYDGQGFSKDFVNKYADAINERASKITTVAADFDYVSPLGKDIAGSHVYYATNQKGEENNLENMKGLLYSAASGIKLVNMGLSHSPGAVFHVENNQITLNDQRDDWQKEVKELDFMSKYVMDNGTKEEQEKGFFAVMSMLQAAKAKNSELEPIVDTRGVMGTKELSSGLDVLYKYSKEQDCKFCENAFKLAGNIVKASELPKKLFRSDDIKSKDIEALKRSAEKNRKIMPKDRLQNIGSNLKLQMNVRKSLAAMIADCKENQVATARDDKENQALTARDDKGSGKAGYCISSSSLTDLINSNKSEVNSTNTISKGDNRDDFER